MAQASYGYFGIAVENPASPGTPKAPTHFLPVKDVDFPIETEFIEIREIRGSRQAYSNFDGPVRPNVSFTTSFYPSTSMGMLLKGLIGNFSQALVSPSTTVRRFTFLDAAALPSFSMERSDAQTSGEGILLQRLNGVKVETMGFSCAYGEDVEVSVSGQGLSFPSTPGSKPAGITAALPAMDPFIFTGATVQVDGVTNNYFKNVDFEFTNMLERQEALRGTREAFKIYEGGLECSLSGTLIFDDLLLYNKLKNSEYLTVTVIFQGSTIDAPNSLKYQARFHWPKLKVASVGIPMTAGEIIEADVEFQVSFDQTTGKLVDIQLDTLDTATAFNYTP